MDLLKASRKYWEGYYDIVKRETGCLISTWPSSNGISVEVRKYSMNGHSIGDRLDISDSDKSSIERLLGSSFEIDELSFPVRIKYIENKN